MENKIDFKLFKKHGYLAIIIALLILFGSCQTYTAEGFIDDSNCGAVSGFRQAAVNLFVFDYVGNYFDMILRIFFILLLITSVILISVAFGIAYKLDDTEEHSILASRMINFSFVTFFLAFIIIFIISYILAQK
jgi:hypothetical protein